jgi:hypothetical protein
LLLATSLMNHDTAHAQQQPPPAVARLQAAVLDAKADALTQAVSRYRGAF